jgi:hypothetical protein
MRTGIIFGVFFMGSTGTYRVGVNTQVRALNNLVVNSNGTTTRVSAQSYLKTFTQHKLPSAVAPVVAPATTQPSAARPGGSPNSSAINQRVQDRLYGNRSKGVGFGNPANKTYTPGATPAEGYTAKNYRESQWRENPQANGINQPANRLRPTTMPTSAVAPRPNLGASAIGALKNLGNASGMAGVFAEGSRINREYLESPQGQAALEKAYGKDFADGFSKQRREENWQKSPFNPFGDAYDWAPWNDRKSKNSLNPEPTVDRPFIPDVNNLPKDPITFPEHTPTGSGIRLDAYSTNNYGFRGFSNVLSFTFTATHPELKALMHIVWRRVGGEIGSNDIWIDPSTIQITREGIPVPGIPGPADLKPIADPTPNREIFPQPAPQFEPEGRPEYPRFPQPDSAPAPQRSPSPSPSPQPSPAPAPMPNQPAPIPLPSIDPTAAPTGDPKPRFDPAPAPSPNRSPSPAPNPSTQPFPGKQRNPNDFHSEQTYDYKVPEIVGQKQREKEPAPYTQPYFPRPDFDACKDPCIADMHDQSKSQKPIDIDYQHFVSCNPLTKEPIFETLTIACPENQSEFMATILNQLAALEGQQCTASSSGQECYVSLPDSAQLKIMQEYPQLVIQYAEDKGSGRYGPPKYSISIPHYQKSMDDTKVTDFPAYTKGNHSGILVLTTNAKMIVNAISAIEAEAMINSLKLFIPIVIRGNAITSITVRKGRALNQIRVVPRIANYYDTGEPGKKPAWRKYF